LRAWIRYLVTISEMKSEETQKNSEKNFVPLNKLQIEQKSTIFSPFWWVSRYPKLNYLLKERILKFYILFVHTLCIEVTSRQYHDSLIDFFLLSSLLKNRDYLYPLTKYAWNLRQEDVLYSTNIYL